MSPSTACLGCAAQRLLSHCPLLEHAVFSHQAVSKQHCIVQQFGMCSMGNLQTCSEAPPCCSELGTSVSCPAKERGDFPWNSTPVAERSHSEHTAGHSHHFWFCNSKGDFPKLWSAGLCTECHS